MEQPAEPAKPQETWVDLEGAARVTGRARTTVAAWARVGALTNNEAQHTGGKWRIALTALERVHRARGGVYWQPDAALPLATVPAVVQDELARLRKRVAALEAALDLALARRSTTPRAAPHAAHKVAPLAASLAAPATPAAPDVAEPVIPVAQASLASGAPADVAEQSGQQPGEQPWDERWMAVSTWAQRRGVHGQRLADSIASGALPAPRHGRWRRGANIIERAWNEEEWRRADAVVAGWQEERRASYTSAAGKTVP